MRSKHTRHMSNHRTKQTTNRGKACAIAMCADTVRRVFEIEATLSSVLDAMLATGEPDAVLAVKHWKSHRDFAVFSAVESELGRDHVVFTRLVNSSHVCAKRERAR